MPALEAQVLQRKVEGAPHKRQPEDNSGGVVMVCSLLRTWDRALDYRDTRDRAKPSDRSETKWTGT